MEFTTTNIVRENNEMSLYKHLIIEERELSMIMLAQGFSLRAIARKLNRSPSTLSRELNRNSNKDKKYSASTAEKRYRKRRKNCGKKPVLLKNNSLKDYVITNLINGWSPEQISGRAKLDRQPFAISYNTIYRAIAKGVLPKSYRLYLRIKRIKNRKKKNDDKRGKITDGISIHDRASDINNRLEFGHWESDTVLGKRHTGCIGTHVERKSGFLIAFTLPNRNGTDFVKTTSELFSTLPNCIKKSFTVDNGQEFLLHKELTANTNMTVYFCDPYAPWQRGTNENTNGLLRQYFPKGTSFEDITDERLQQVVDLINNRPRKRLGYKTPLEIFSNVLHLT